MGLSNLFQICNRYTRGDRFTCRDSEESKCVAADRGSEKPSIIAFLRLSGYTVSRLAGNKLKA
jgi:hypothetical protein